MSGRFHIYIMKNALSPKIDSRPLCPECAASNLVQEMYERNGGALCATCGISPQEYEASNLSATISTGGGCIIRA